MDANWRKKMESFSAVKRIEQDNLNTDSHFARYQSSKLSFYIGFVKEESIWVDEEVKSC